MGRPPSACPSGEAINIGPFKSQAGRLISNQADTSHYRIQQAAAGIFELPVFSNARTLNTEGGTRFFLARRGELERIRKQHAPRDHANHRFGSPQTRNKIDTQSYRGMARTRIKPESTLPQASAPKYLHEASADPPNPNVIKLKLYLTFKLIFCLFSR